MSTDSQEQLLARLQSEVNLVLEQTGRVFAAAKSNAKTAPLAQISQLKQVLQKSDQSFHEALDQLEQELQLAKLVMRRDLALCREASGLGKRAEPNDPNAIDTNSKQDNVSERKVEDGQRSNDAVTEDVAMQDSEAVEAQEASKVANPDDTVAQELVGIENQVSASANGSADPEASSAAPEAAEKPSDAVLQLDTQAQPQTSKAEGQQPGDDDIPPDTGTFSNTNDLESLFGGPLSGAPGDAPDFNLDPNNNDDFDFDAFAAGLDNNSADNDNISALLPGLEDYANTQSNDGGEPDFDAIFSTALPANTDAGDQPGIPHRDSTFDDLGDLLDFNVGEFTGEMNGEGSNENNEFDFSMQ